MITIKELKESKIELKLVIDVVKEQVEKETKKGKMMMQEVHAHDETDVIKITLWGEDCGKLVLGKTYIITDMKVTWFQFEPQLSMTKSTTITPI